MKEVEIPKRLWVEWSETDAKVINDQSDRFALGLRGKTIKVSVVAKALHRLLARYRYALANAEGEEAGDDPKRDWIRERAATAKLKRQQLAGALISLDESREAWDRVATEIRAAAVLIAKRDGECADLLTEALERADAILGGANGAKPSGRKPRTRRARKNAGRKAA